MRNSIIRGRYPGILASPFPTTINVPCGDTTCPCNNERTNRCGTPQEQMPYHSDIDHPSVFWIMNGWNDFQYNMADGAGTCGFCYWLTPAYMSGHSQMEHWEGYAAEQRGEARAAMAPLENFYGNSCSTAMNSFNVVGNTSACLGVVWVVDTNLPRVTPVKPDPKLVPTVNAAKPRTPETVSFYPNIDMGGGHFGTRCPNGADCATDRKVRQRRQGLSELYGHGARPLHQLVQLGADQRCGDLAAAPMEPGAAERTNRRSKRRPDLRHRRRLHAILGNPGNMGARAQERVRGQPRSRIINGPRMPGPFNTTSGLTCDEPFPGNYCLSAKEGISMPKDNFVVNQRLFNIYDGPSYEDSNGFLDITPTSFKLHAVGPPDGNTGNCAEADNMYERVIGVPKDKSNACYLPNAAIAWKQPNGFYYPPAFHSQNLFFDKVPIRHYVIEPSFSPNGLFKTDLEAVKKRYCNFNNNMFNNFSDIDRQTELNDDDGSLTGLVKTISVNQDAFFNAPYSTLECASDDRQRECQTDPTETSPGTANTSPYDYVSTVLFPDCGSTASCTGNGTARPIGIGPRTARTMTASACRSIAN